MDAGELKINSDTYDTRENLYNIILMLVFDEI